MPNTRKHPPAILTLEDMRKRAQADAKALVIACGGQNKAAFDIGMSKGRFSFIVHGQWRQVAVNQIDIAMLATGRIIREKDLDMTTELRALAKRMQTQLSDLHVTVGEFLKVAKKL